MTVLAQRCRQTLEGSWIVGERDGVPFAYTRPSPGRYRWQWYWDSCFAAIAWRHFDSARSRAELETCGAAWCVSAMSNRPRCWTQLAGGLLLPGGAWGGVGVGAFILHRFGMPNRLIAEREFNLSFLNTAVDALVLIVAGVGLAVGIFAGEHHLLLTVLPAAVAVTGIALALLIAHRAGNHAVRLKAKHPKIAGAITTLVDAVDDTEQLLLHRGAWTSVLGVLAYLGFDVLVLWSAFLAIHAQLTPGFGVVVMAYIIGALGGSIPLPASAGTVGGMGGGMLILYKVDHNAAIAAVLLHQAIGLLVPLAGGGIAYAILRRRFGPVMRRASNGGSPRPVR